MGECKAAKPIQHWYCRQYEKKDEMLVDNDKKKNSELKERGLSLF